MLRSILSLCSIQVLGTPTREQIREMNPNYTEFKFPQIKAHPWTKVSQQVQEPFYFSKIHAWITACLCACDANMPLHTAIQPHHIHPIELHEALTAPHHLWTFRMTQTNSTQTFLGIWVLHICHKTLLLRSFLFFFCCMDKAFWACHQIIWVFTHAPWLLCIPLKRVFVLNLKSC